MRQLECLLQEIPAAEREEALQYYNDYFEDAGPEKEREVLEALGNPARVAESIKRDLKGGWDEDSETVRRKNAVVKYGELQREEGGSGGSGGIGGSGGSGGAGGLGGAGGSGGAGGPGGAGGAGGSGGSGGPGKDFWLVFGVICGALVLLPAAFSLLTGLVGTLVGIVTAWFALILGFGMAAIILFIVMLVSVFLGVWGLFLAPMGGLGLIGCGLLCGGLGLLFLALTLLMAAWATPAIWRFLVGAVKKLTNWVKNGVANWKEGGRKKWAN